MAAGEVDQLSRPVDDGAAVGAAGDRDRSTASHFEEALVAQQPQRAQDRVGVDAEDGGEIPGLRDAVAGTGLPLSDRAADLRRHLFVQRRGVAAIDGAEADFALVRGSLTEGMRTTIIASMSVQLKPPPEPGLQRALEALFREARRLERRRRRRHALLALMACAAVAGCRVRDRRDEAGPRGSAAGSSSAGPPVGAQVVPKRPSSLAVGPDGQLYIADDARNQILEWTGRGPFRVVAGTGRAGFSGDWPLGVARRLDQPFGMTVAPDGTLYFADSGNGRIRAISPAGTITTIAGDGLRPTGRDPWVANGTPAEQAALGYPNDVAIGPGGDLYFDASANEVLRRAPDGSLSIVAGNRSELALAGVGGPATKASPDEPWGLALDRRGDLFINGGNTRKLLMVTPGGRMTLPIGPQPFYPRGPGGMVTTRRGEVVAMTDDAVVRLSPHAITTIVNLCCARVPGVGARSSSTASRPHRTAASTPTPIVATASQRRARAREIHPGGRGQLLWTSAR